MLEIRKNCPTKGKTSVSDSYIDAINILVNDNENRKTNTIIFKKCFLISLSSLVLAFGTSDQLQFSCTFVFDTFDIEATTKELNN